MWQIPSGSTALIAKVKNGTATLADLQAGGSQKGATTDDYTCNDNGNDCTDRYAASVLGVTPSATLTWFQAQQFSRAAGTPDGTPCLVSAGSAGPTGTTGCVSNAGAFDMVGNLDEWIADWGVPANTCGSDLFGTGDFNCMTIDPAASFTASGPAALIRGGDFTGGASAGVFAVDGLSQPSGASGIIGFRCAR